MADEVFPDSVKDFVFDLHDASRRSFIAAEEHALYSGTFREMTAKVSEPFCVGQNETNSKSYDCVLVCIYLSPLDLPTIHFFIFIIFVSLVLSKCSLAVSCCHL